MRFLLAAALAAAFPAAISAQSFGTTVVAPLTRGTAVSTEISGQYIPNDPVRGQTVTTIVNTLPPNPIQDGPGLGDGGPAGTTATSE